MLVLDPFSKKVILRFLEVKVLKLLKKIGNCSSTSDLADFRASLIFSMRKIECLGLRFIARPVSLGLKMHPNTFGIAFLIVVVNRYYFPDISSCIAKKGSWKKCGFSLTLSTHQENDWPC